MEHDTLLALESLNRIRLTDDERAAVLEDYARRRAPAEALLAACPTDGVEPMARVHDLCNVFRADCPRQDFSREALLEGAPAHTEGFWQVPKLVE